MRRGSRAFALGTIAFVAFTLSLGCGQTCTCHGDVCADCSGSTAAAPTPDAATPGADDATTDSSVPDAAPGTTVIDGGFGSESGDASDDGAECITGCARGTMTCAASDPPIAWTCTGSGINSGGRFLEAGCTSLPVNSVAWCCPTTFMSPCVCTPGQDWTCNDDPAISSIHGMCLPDHSCSCGGFALNPVTGRCR